MRKKILIYTCMFNRPRVSELFLMSIARVKAHVARHFDIEVFAMVSGIESEAVCRSYNVPFMEYENQPLGKKWNAGMHRLLSDNTAFDYVMIMGDDDIMSSALLDLYKRPIKEGMHYFGMNTVYFYSPSQNKAINFRYQYAAPKLIGCGRMISREAITKAGWHLPVEFLKASSSNLKYKIGDRVYIPKYQAEYLKGMDQCIIVGPASFRLWGEALTAGLDGYSEMCLLANGYLPEVIQTPKPLITDVKTRQNIWSFDSFKTMMQPASVEEATAFIGPEEKSFINSFLTV